MVRGKKMFVLIFSVWENRARFKDQKKATSPEDVREREELLEYSSKG